MKIIQRYFFLFLNKDICFKDIWLIIICKLFLLPFFSGALVSGMFVVFFAGIGGYQSPLPQIGGGTGI